MSHGPKAIEVAASLGFELMPWQKYVLDVALEVDRKTGLLVYRRVILTVPRQSGKTTLLLALFVHRALGFDTPQVMTYAAQTGVDARKKFIDEHVPLLEGSPLRPLFRTRRTNGHEAMLWKNGSRHHISAGTEKSGHGSTLDLAVVDEAFAQSDGRLEQAFSPATITRPQPQLWFVSTAGKPSDDWFHAKVGAGRDLVDGKDGTAFFEWSADEDADPHDPAVWRSCMPALGLTVTEQVIRAELAAFEAEGKLGEFRRAYLNQWVQQDTEVVFPDWDSWASGTVDPSKPVLSVEISNDNRGRAWLASAQRMDLTTHVQLLDVLQGQDTAADVIRIAKEQRAPVVIDSASEAATLIAPLKKAGVKVIKVTGSDRAVACANLYDLGVQQRLMHNGDLELADAARALRWKDLGEGARVFTRRKSTGEIGPLYAATFAAWGLGQRGGVVMASFG